MPGEESERESEKALVYKYGDSRNHPLEHEKKDNDRKFGNDPCIVPKRGGRFERFDLLANPLPDFHPILQGRIFDRS